MAGCNKDVSSGSHVCKIVRKNVGSGECLKILCGIVSGG